MKTVYFVSSNEKKYREIELLGKKEGIKFAFHKMDILELQTKNIEELMKEKAKKAYQELRRPVLVEHTALEISAFEGLPALQTSYFYQKIGYEEIVNYCNYKSNFVAYAKSIFCFCDGKHYYIGEGIDSGTIVKVLDGIKGTDGFDWDVIFIPDEDNIEKNTYALDLSKKQIRNKAWKELTKKVNWHECLEDVLDKEKEQQHLEELAELIKQKKVILFIGAGISASLNGKGEINFPTWKQLIDQLGKNAEYDKELFSMYGDNMMLAEYSSQSNKNLVYETIKKNFEITDKIIPELKSSEIYKIICNLKCPIIYTTNYDELIEEALHIHKIKYSKVSNIEDMKKIEHNATRVMKFHGDVNDENSIVLAESEYFKRMDFESFMDIQFQADILQYHVLFLGYSMSDINIKLLLYLARNRWTDKGEALKAYIYTATPNEIQRQVFENNNIFTISGDEADKKKGTLKFLQDLEKLVCFK